MILLPDTPQGEAVTYAERIRNGVTAAVSAFPDVKISIGVSEVPHVEQYSDPQEDANARKTTRDILIERADNGIYAAKGLDRNKTIIWKGEDSLGRNIYSDVNGNLYAETKDIDSEGKATRAYHLLQQVTNEQGEEIIIDYLQNVKFSREVIEKNKQGDAIQTRFNQVK